MYTYIALSASANITEKLKKERKAKENVFAFQYCVCVCGGGGGGACVSAQQCDLCIFILFTAIWAIFTPSPISVSTFLYIFFFHPVMSLSVQCIRNVLIVIMLQCTYSSFLSLPLTHARTVCCGKLTQPEWNIIKSTPNLPERQHTNLRYIKCNT